jgi:4-carboxymuconolactone decarboxylase
VETEERRKQLLERFNPKAIDTGVQLQGEFFLRMVHEFAELDEQWTETWLTWIYDVMYNRRVLDDRTRILIVIGESVVSGYFDQLANHMRSATRVGATAEEILEVILQASIYAGMPKVVTAMRIYRELMSDLGVLHLTEPPFSGDARD